MEKIQVGVCATLRLSGSEGRTSEKEIIDDVSELVATVSRRHAVAVGTLGRKRKLTPIKKGVGGRRASRSRSAALGKMMRSILKTNKGVALTAEEDLDAAFNSSMRLRDIAKNMQIAVSTAKGAKSRVAYASYRMVLDYLGSLRDKCLEKTPIAVIHARKYDSVFGSVARWPFQA